VARRRSRHEMRHRRLFGCPRPAGDIGLTYLLPRPPRGIRGRGSRILTLRRARLRDAGGVATRTWSSPRVLAIAIGGAVGATVRWAVLEAFPNKGPFPWGALTVNIAGSLLLGALVAEEWHPPRLRLLLHDACAIGFCGGLTTFSTYAVDVVGLLDSDHLATAVAYTVTTVLATVIAVIVGAAALRLWRTAGRPVDEAPCITAIAFVVTAAAGALARAEASRRWNQPGGLAAGTLIVNAIGSLLLGLMSGWTGSNLTVLGVGGLGAFTTFSGFARDIVAALELRRIALASGYLAATLAIGILAAAAGTALA